MEITVLRHRQSFPRLEPPASCEIVHCPTQGRVHSVRGLQGPDPRPRPDQACVYLVFQRPLAGPVATTVNSDGLNQSSSHDSRGNCGNCGLTTYSEAFTAWYTQKKQGQLRHMPTSLLFAKVGGNRQRSYVYLIYKSGDTEGLVPVPKLSDIIHDWRIRCKWSWAVIIFTSNDPRFTPGSLATLKHFRSKGGSSCN